MSTSDASTAAYRPTSSRPRHGRMIAGVCAGIARRFGWDPTVVRIVAAVSISLPGPQVIAYSVSWALMPNDRD
ncbi:hypothetical protein OY671_001392 [Metschnikowia pulcherrima]|nr:hypothetical protein OY671_001392 [Metschnikowia pulcherrima]